MSTEIDLRSELVDIMQRMDDAGLNHGTAGNVSVRFEDGVLISPSGIPASLLRPEQVVFMHLNGDYSGDVKPSSEWRMHTGILEKRPDMQAVVHCHSRFATTLACARKPIPFLHYMTAVSGGAEIPVAPYATFGTQALADEIVQTLDGRFGCLMANSWADCGFDIPHKSAVHCRRNRDTGRLLLRHALYWRSRASDPARSCGRHHAIQKLRAALKALPAPLPGDFDACAGIGEPALACFQFNRSI